MLEHTCLLKHTCSWLDKLIVLWILNRQAKIFLRKLVIDDQFKNNIKECFSRKQKKINSEKASSLYKP